LEPVTLTEAVLESVTVNVTDCPVEMLVELAVIETVGSDDELVLTVIVVCALALPLEFVATAV
jgi:hypothetical protein